MGPGDPEPSFQFLQSASSEILMVHLCSTNFLLMRDKLKTAFELLELEEEPIKKKPAAMTKKLF